MSRVYIGNLDPHVGQDELMHACSKFAMPASVWIARNPGGFAFVVRLGPFPRRQSRHLAAAAATASATPRSLAASAATAATAATSRHHCCATIAAGSSLRARLSPTSSPLRHVRAQEFSDTRAAEVVVAGMQDALLGQLP